MRAGGWKTANPISRPSFARGDRLGRWISPALIGLGALFLLVSLGFAADTLLRGWLIEQDRYLLAADVAPLPLATMPWMAPSGSDATPGPSEPAALALASPTVLTSTPVPSASPRATAQSALAGTVAPVAEGPTAAVILRTDAIPTPTHTAAPPPPQPVQIRIPSLSINRSIIPLARTRDELTGVQTWDTEKLFRNGRKDRVGHSEGSAYPGEEGNMVLVGHSSGSGRSGVFDRLKKLKRGHKVYVVDSEGQTLTYQVTTIEKVSWRQQNLGELTQHLSFLTPGGSERLTLVSCAGANVQSFPERIYVVAEPLK